MRTSLFVAVACLGVHVAPAGAQQPGYPYPYPYYQYPTQGPPPVAQPQQPAPPPGGVVIIQSPLPVLVQQAPAPAQLPPPPPQVAPAANPGYYYPPPGWAAPIYSYPPPPYQPPQQRLPVYRAQPAPRHASPCRGSCPGNRGGASPSTRPEDRARFFSVGLRLSALTLNQSIGDKNTTLGGGGVEVRFRSRGRIGLEASLDALRGEFQQGGPIRRDTVPLQLSLLMYVFPNADSRIFNLYFLGGAGVSSTKMQLINPVGAEVQQEFREWDLHLGVGAELRFKWLALRADVRGLKLWRDDKDNDGRWYGDVDGAPVPRTSAGAQGTLGAAIWF